MKRPSMATVLGLGLFLVACESPAPTASTADGPLFRSTNGIIHHASVGGNDACGALGLAPGCDKSFSLVANQAADGSVSGQWQDKFGGDLGGVHVDVDCLIVYGNQAVIGGVVKNAWGPTEGAIGSRALTSVWDNGTSSKDPQDAISFSYLVGTADCSTFGPGVFTVLALDKGQVKVW